MQIQLIWLGIGIFYLTACVGSKPVPNEENTPQAFQTIAAPVQATSSTISPPSPLPTPTLTAQPSPLTLQSPLPSPTISASETPIKVEITQTPGESAQLTDEAALIYQRSGGIADITQAWSVYPNGRVVAGDGREWQVKPQQVEQLLNNIEALGFFELKDNYVPQNTCCDRFTHQLTVRRGNEVHTITTLDAAPGAPAELQTILTEVNNFIANLQ
jgi:hypothetical protein